MAQEVTLEKFAQTMEEGTVVACLVKVGDKVKTGDVIFEVETDKATIEMESPANGFVKHILVRTGQTVPVDTPIMILGGKNEQVPQSYIDSLKVAAADPTLPAPTQDTQPATPAFKLGAKLPLSRTQKLIGRKMLHSKRQIPCFYLNAGADVTEIVALRTKMNKSAQLKVAYTDFILRAAALALKQYPLMTGQLAGEYIHLADDIDIGLAITVNDDLVAPVVKNVDKKDVRQIAAETQALVAKANGHKLSLAELQGGCMTLSNLGALGIESFTAIVVPGQCSILGVGRITDTCVPANADISVRKLMNLTLSVDHRVVNGAYAAQFLDFLKRLLEEAVNL